MYEALVGLDITTLKPYPLLAESWESRASGQSYVFKLRRGVRFHDGTTFTAQDVKLSFDRIVALQKSFGWERLKVIKQIRVIDDYTVEFIIEPGPTPFPILANTVLMVSGDAIRKNEKSGDWANPWFKDKVVGTGPYRLVEWRQNDRFLLARYDGYWGKKPFFKDVVILDVPEASTQTLMILQGQVDVATTIAPDQVDRLRNLPTLNVIQEKGPYNLSLRLLAQGDVPTADRQVRRAIAYAMDYQRLWSVRGKDLIQTDGPIPSVFMGGWRPSNLYTYDLAKARQELAKSKFPNGGFKLTAVIPTGQAHQQTAMEILKAELQKLNIDLDIQVRDWVPVYRDFLRWKSENDPRAQRPIQGLTLGLPPLVVDASNYVQIYECASGLNFIAYCNPEVDKLLETAARSRTVAERDNLYRQAVKIILEDSPDVYIGLNNMTAVVRSDIKGFKIQKIWHPYGVRIDALSRQ
ncbi:MAG: hypothetical protein A2W26_06130 [Acidobacteria bacterium RBG_16_64_8]|nr:MAG: hypothetical protein A2W26_06130 [Acidobacteria bacterium RBG_16_64_8]